MTLSQFAQLVAALSVGCPDIDACIGCFGGGHGRKKLPDGTLDPHRDRDRIKQVLKEHLSTAELAALNKLLGLGVRSVDSILTGKTATAPFRGCQTGGEYHGPLHEFLALLAKAVTITADETTAVDPATVPEGA